MSNENEYNREDGRPLPPKPGIEQFLPDPQRTRPMVPQRGDFGTTRETLNEKKARETDDRVRNHRVQQVVEWFRRAKGRVPTDSEVRAHLGEPEQEGSE